MPSALIISFVEWAGAWQRPHHLAYGLARRGWRVTYASPGYLHRWSGRIDNGLTLPATLTVLEPPALPGGSRWAWAAATNQSLMRKYLNRATHAPWDLIIFNDPRWADTASSIPANKRVFDCMDDLSAIAPSAEWSARMEQAALRTADAVWTGTFTLAERLAGQHPRIQFIPCGVDADHFASPGQMAIAAARDEMPPGDGPVAGYFGVLNERFDMELVETLLDSANWRVALIGPATSRAPKLPKNPRLRWLGPRPYAQLPAFLAHFDLALIPYHVTGPSRFLYPVKALEYLAGGKPVLSSPLPDMIRFLSSYVEVADGPEAWRRYGQALFDNRSAALAKAQAGRDYARSRSWDQMVDEMLMHVQ